jgi:hypothetical protein
MKWLLALLLASGCLFWLFHDPAPSEEEVVGSYAGTYKGFMDQVELTKDHKFNQILRIPNGETMKSSGTWRLTNKALDLDGYIFFIDEQVAGSSDKPTRTSVTFSAYRGMLIRDWETGFYKLTQQ